MVANPRTADDGERTPDRDQRIRTLRFDGGDSLRAQSLWQQYANQDDRATDPPAEARLRAWPELQNGESM